MPKADATGLAPKKSADTTLPHTIRRCGRVWLLLPPAGAHPSGTPASTIVQCQKISPISLVESLSGGLGLKTRRSPGRFCRALQIRFFGLLPPGYRSCLYKRVSYPARMQSRQPPATQAQKESEKLPGKYSEDIGGKQCDPLQNLKPNFVAITT